MNPEEHALLAVVQMLDRHDIPYMVTGSVATSYHGRPRATHDSDVVIDPTPAQLESLVHDLEEAGFYVDPQGARAALEQRRQFNAIDAQHACKIDLIVKKNRPFSEEEFTRRLRVDLAFARQVAVVTPEDAILSKLEWAARSGDSERQLRDAAGVVELNPAIDVGYINRWVGALGVADLWRQLRASAPEG